MGDDVPPAVLRSLLGQQAGTVHWVGADPLTSGTGAATGRVVRVRGEVDGSGGVPVEISFVLKALEPVTTGRHAPYADDETHWAYWRRELLAYSSGLLPSGQGLTAPRYLGVEANVLYLQDVSGLPEQPDRAVYNLARWQAQTAIPDVSWLVDDQLGQRTRATRLDWHDVDADPRAAALWNRRHELLARVNDVPRVLSHGDYSQGNLLAHGEDTMVLDWATFGVAPVGADLAHLALSTGIDPTATYIATVDGRWNTDDVLQGFRTTLVLVGASRVHWMLSRDLDVPDWYVDFLWEYRPD